MADLNPTFSRILGGPNKWGLIVDGLARHGRKDSEVIFQAQQDRDRGSPLEPGPVHVVITRLGSDCIVSGSPFCPREELRYEKMADMLGEDFDWENAWFFEGHSPTGPAFPTWGIYSTQSRRGVLAGCYIGA